MTIEEAIKDLQMAQGEEYGLDGDALDMAIEALRFQRELVRCGKCANALPWNGDTSYCSVYSYDGSKVLVIDEGYCHMGERRDTE